MTEGFSFVTDTATICAFDVAALKHRLEDDPDWWSDVDEELLETNSANVLFIALGGDGEYKVTFGADPPGPHQTSVTSRLRCPSGRLFVGPGEDVTGGELEPSPNETSGKFFDISPRLYELTIYLAGNRKLNILLLPFDGESRNYFDDSPSFPD